MPVMRNELFTDHYGLVIDYLAEALRELDPARAQRPAAVLRLQPLGHPGLERFRASPGLERRQPLAATA